MAARFIREARCSDAGRASYPYSLPLIRSLAERGWFEFSAGVTFICGENGSGKSTLVEAVAVAAGFNPEGGSRNFRFSTRRSESELGASSMDLRWGTEKPVDGYFLRAESYYNVATEIERLDADELQPGLIAAAYGGVSPQAQSHGESFLALLTNRFRPKGLYILDEPEAALSPRGCMTALARLAELVRQDCQLIVATHSPILLALPGATILQIDDGTMSRVAYDDALPVAMTRDFLNGPERYLRHLV